MHVLTPQLVLATGNSDKERKQSIGAGLLGVMGKHYLKSISNSPRRKLLQRRKYTIDCLWAGQKEIKALEKQQTSRGTLYQHTQLPMGPVHRDNRSLQTINRLMNSSGISRNRSKLLNNLSFNGTFTNKLKSQTANTKGKLSKHMGKSEILRLGRTILYSGNILRGKADRRRQTFNIGLASKLIEAIETIEAG